MSKRTEPYVTCPRCNTEQKALDMKSQVCNECGHVFAVVLVTTPEVVSDPRETRDTSATPKPQVDVDYF